MDVAYAARYRELYDHHWWWRAREAAVLAELRRLAPAGGWKRILDVGCGDGLLFPKLESFGEVEGVEPDPSMRAEAHGSRIHTGPFESFDPGRRYSLILMLDVVEHVADPVAFLQRGVALLEPGGLLFITLPAFSLLWTTHDVVNHHLARYTRRTFRNVARRAGMRIDRMAYFFHWLFFAKLAVRGAESLTRPRPTPPHLPARWLNRFAYLLSRAEQHVLSRMPLPFGSSLLVVGGRPRGAPR